MNIATRLAQLRRSPLWHVQPPSGLPQVEAGHVLPADVIEFYEHCGGLELNSDSAYSIEIVPPSDVVRANLQMLTGLSEKQVRESLGDRSWNWYVIAVAIGSGDDIVIDLEESRHGRCYEGFHETYALQGQSPIIAWSFTDLLDRIIASPGEYFYWMEPTFDHLGDAYD